MDFRQIEEEILSNREIIHICKRKLRLLETQKAAFGLYLPPYLQLEIDQAEEQIAQCKENILDLEEMALAEHNRIIRIKKERAERLARMESQGQTQHPTATTAPKGQRVTRRQITTGIIISLLVAIYLIRILINMNPIGGKLPNLPSATSNLPSATPSVTPRISPTATSMASPTPKP